jgi:uncharacterized membrane protein
MSDVRSYRGQFLLSLLTSSLLSLALFSFGAWRNHSFSTFSYLPLNLVLSWIPLLLAIRLIIVLKDKLWSSWEGISLSLLWLVFLPNSFYMISDFVHLQDVRRVNIIFDTLMFSAFVYTAVALGFTSLYMIHVRLKQRVRSFDAAIFITITLFLCSVAIYLGRDLRWSTWDIITNPGGLLFDVSDRLQHLSSYPTMLLTIGVFFVVLCAMYNLIWKASNLAKHSSNLY